MKALRGCKQEGETRLRWPAVGVAPLWGAALLLHTLQLQPHFQLQDICRQVLLEADVAGHSGASPGASPLSMQHHHSLCGMGGSTLPRKKVRKPIGHSSSAVSPSRTEQ